MIIRIDYVIILYKYHHAGTHNHTHTDTDTDAVQYTNTLLYLYNVVWIASYVLHAMCHVLHNAVLTT